MKINIGRRAIAKGLLSFIGIQALAVVIGLCQKYIFATVKAPPKGESEKIYDCRNEILYGVISPLRIMTESARAENRVLSISLVGTPSVTTVAISTGPSGDIAPIDSTMDFLI